MDDTTRQPRMPVRILFVQSGDYREAFTRLRGGGPETYYAQQHTVDYVGALARRADRVGVLFPADAPYTEVLPNGVTCYGLHHAEAGPADVLAVTEAFDPTHLVLRSPVLYVLDWALARGVAVLPLFAESFASTDPAMRDHYAQLRDRLNHPRIRWVANHNTPACLSLAGLGVAPGKIIPYDFKVTRERTPDFYAARQAAPARQPFKLIFVGALLPDKGVFDCVEALKGLRGNGVAATLTVAGPGDAAAVAAAAASLGVAAWVTCRGVVPNAGVIPLMREHDAVLIPSRHTYPEGLPLTLYEALCARTPVIVSDHPMLRARVRHGETGLVFRAGDAAHLGEQVAALRADPALYARLSEATRQAWQQLQCPVEWSRLLDIFTGGTPEEEAWLASHAVAGAPAGPPSPTRAA